MNRPTLRFEMMNLDKDLMIKTGFDSAVLDASILKKVCLENTDFKKLLF